MPNKKASKNDLRQNIKRRAHNLRIKTNVKQRYNQAELLLKQGKIEEAKTAVKAFQKAADKAVKKKVISRNKAGRKKSALMKKTFPKKSS